MNIQLIQGTFSNEDAIEILAQMIQIKINYHESKIHKNLNEEDIKMRESRINKLRNAWDDIKKELNSKGEKCSVNAEIMINFL